MLSLRIPSLLKRKEAWRRAFNWLSQQDCSIAGSLCPPPLRPNTLASYRAGSHVSQRAHLYQLASPVVKAAATLASAYESSTLSDEATHGLKTAFQQYTLVRREAAGRFTKEDGLRRIVNDLILGSRHGDQKQIGIAMAELHAFRGQMHNPTLQSVMAEFRMQPGSSQIAEEFMNLMASKGVVMEERSYNCFLMRLCQDDNILRAFEVLTDLGKAADEDASGVVPKPNTRLVDIVLAASYRLNNLSIFYKTLDFMKRRKLQAQSTTYLEIMKMAGLKRRLSELREAWAAAVASLAPPLSISLHSVRVVNLSRLGSFTEALVAFEEMKAAMCFYGWDPEGQKSRKGVWHDRQGSSLGAGEPGGQQGWPGGTDWRACQVAGRDWDGSSRLNLVYTSLIGAAASEGNTEAFLTLSEEMKKLGIGSLSDEVYWNMLLCSTANSSMLSDAKEVAGSMLKRGIDIQPETYNVWIKACCKTGNLNAAEGLLVEALSKKASDSSMFRTLIYACIRENDIQRGEQIAFVMKKAGLKPSQDHYAALFGLVGLAHQQSVVKIARSSMMALLFEKKRENILHSTASFHAAMWSFGSLGLIREVMEQLRWTRGLRPHFHTPLTNFLVYNTAIHACLHLGKLAEFSELIQMMEKDYLKLGVSAHRDLVKEESYGNSDLQSAMKVIDALPSIGREPRLTTFNFLIQVVCHDDNFYAGRSLLHLMVHKGVARDRNTYLHLLDCAARSGNLMPMRKLIAEMHQDGFAADMDTCLAIVTAHVRIGRHTIAVQLLKTLVDQIRKIPRAVENGSEAFFENLEKWILKDKERYLAKVLKGNYKHVNKDPILDVEKEKELSTILEVDNTEKIDACLGVEKDEETSLNLDVEKSERKESDFDVEKEEEKRTILDVDATEKKDLALDVDRSEKDIVLDVEREEETSQILDVEKSEQEDQILDMEKAKQRNPIVHLKKEEDQRRSAHFLMWMRRKNA